ncbi:hypothetical protein C8R45DRAFT_992738, partial [Mycena sanguinolenta]
MLSVAASQGLLVYPSTAVVLHGPTFTLVPRIVQALQLLCLHHSYSRFYNVTYLARRPRRSRTPCQHRDDAGTRSACCRPLTRS